MAGLLVYKLGCEPDLEYCVHWQLHISASTAPNLHQLLWTSGSKTSSPQPIPPDSFIPVFSPFCPLEAAKSLFSSTSKTPLPVGLETAFFFPS